VNALTLYGIYRLNLTPTDASSFESTIGGFFGNLKTLAGENKLQAVILSGMLFTLIVWVFAFLFLLLGALFYVFFLWHYIPRQDGGLLGYCERKVNKRLNAIVKKKINKALAKEERQRVQVGDKASQIPGAQPRLERQATLPSFVDMEKGDKLPEMPMLHRNDTVATLPLYTSRPGTPGSIELSSLDQKRPLPSRQATNGTTVSANSYSSRAPLIAGAADMGFERSASPAPTLPNLDLNGYQVPRLGTASSNRSFENGHPMNAVDFPDALPSMPERVRSPASGLDGFNGPSQYVMNGQIPPGRSTYTRQPTFNDGRPSPAPSGYQSRVPNGPAYPPARSATNLPFPTRQQRFAPQRNMTAPQPMRQRDDYFSGGAGMNQNQRSYGNGYNYDDSRY
jgi:hypothetical protein